MEPDRPFEVFDRKKPSPALASLMTREDAERVTALLNATVSGCGGGSLAALSNTNLSNLRDNAENAVRARAAEDADRTDTSDFDDEVNRDVARGAGLAGDTLDCF